MSEQTQFVMPLHNFRSIRFIFMQFKCWLAPALIIGVMMPALAVMDSRDSLLQKLRASDIPSEKVSILNELAGVFSDEDPVRAGNYASQALFIAESIQDAHGQSVANYFLGKIAQKNKQYTRAMDYLLKAGEGFMARNDQLWLARVYLLISDEYNRNFEYGKGIHLLYQAREIFKKEKENLKLAETYNAIGGNFYDQGNYEKAFEYYSTSLDLFTELNEVQSIGSLYNNIGEIYRLQNEYLKAVEYYHKSLAIALQFDNQVKLAIVYTNLGNTYLERNHLDSAGYYLNLGKELSDYTMDINRISSAKISLGKLALAKNDWENAWENINRGYELAVQASNNNNKLIASRLLSQLHEEKGDYEKAYEYFVEYRNTDDSLHNISDHGKITELEMNLLFELENEVNRIKVQRINLRYFTIGFMLISSILILVLLYGRQRIKAKQAITLHENLQMEKERLQEEIDFKNRELATNVMYLVKKNELINYISEKLLKAKNNFKPPVRKDIKEILMDLQANVDENIWRVFEDRFREVHHEFYDNLLKQFPNLSDNEKKLCAFIRLNMSTKDIAAITHQNINTIEVARTRLRKKLNISNTEINLNSFLSNI